MNIGNHHSTEVAELAVRVFASHRGKLILGHPDADEEHQAVDQILIVLCESELWLMDDPKLDKTKNLWMFTTSQYIFCSR